MTNGASGEGKKEAVKTYVDQTKLLVTLASAFLFAPAGLVGILKDKAAVSLSSPQLCTLLIIQGLFIFSVIAGYVVLGTIVGSLDEDRYDVYRPATMWFSRLQVFSYAVGLVVFAFFALSVI
jgi:hypothetical protein